MGNTLLVVVLSLASIVGEPTYNFAMEMLARNVSVQDTKGVADPGVPVATDWRTPAPPRDLPRASQPEQSAEQAAGGNPDASAAPILPVLASATVARPIPPAPPPPIAVPREQVADAPPILKVPSSPTLLALARDPPTRRPDGSVFMPIAVQGMIGMRTRITRVESLSAAVRIPGRIVTSRDVGTMIQSMQAGVIEAAEGTVPRIGTRVTRGQLLAYQKPVLDASRAAEVNAKIVDLEGLVHMGEQRISRLREVMFIRYRQSKIEAVKAEIDSYRRQLRIYQGLLNDRMEIRARTSGVVSRVNFVVGQMVDAQTTLFEMVDPTRLWVEAAAFDPGLGQDIESAQAITGDGRVLQLRFSGGGLTLQNQAVPLQFEVIRPASDVQIGRPVTVVVRRLQKQMNGIRLPITAVVHNANGETVVWQRLSAETFMSRPVQVLPLDGNNVIVASGLMADMRIVTESSAMLTQVR
mgnify:CR=1 FL=1